MTYRLTSHGNPGLQRRALIGVAMLLLPALSGCGTSVQREYVFTRQTPAVGRNSPTTFVVRLSADPKKNNVVWFQEARDEDGDLGRTTETWTTCTFLDYRNWVCDMPGVPNRIEMKDGALSQHYWGEERNFVEKRRIFGMSF